MISPDDARLLAAQAQQVEKMRSEVEKLIRFSEITSGRAEDWPPHTATVAMLCAIWRRLDAIEQALETK